jgi:hypothetical protein
MKKFTCVQDIGDLKSALAEAFEIKKERFKYVELGRNKTLMMIFFNSSLRTRLSTQKAAINLGMNVMVLDINQRAFCTINYTYTLRHGIGSHYIMVLEDIHFLFQIITHAPNCRIPSKHRFQFLIIQSYT